MHHTTLISCEVAARHVEDPDWAFIDCRYLLIDPEEGERLYQASHIVGAAYCHLDRDLSGVPIPGVTGRNPLPEQEDLVSLFCRLGIDSATQVVAYDAGTGVTASRLWWSLNWAGHRMAAVLDGGLARWADLQLPTQHGIHTRQPRIFIPTFQPLLAVDLAQIEQIQHDPAWALIDVRGAERFHRDETTTDPMVGHIPGSKNLPYSLHYAPNGLHLEADQVRKQIEPVAQDANHTVYTCGAGVTATHAALMHVYAGMGMPKIYPGSMSEWVADGTRAVER